MKRAETALVGLVAAHSLGVGLALLFLPGWSAVLGGFGDVRPLFFVRQAGAFHLVVVAGYLIEYFRYGGVTFLVTTKSIAVIFLGALWLGDGMPWVVPVSALADGLMGFLAWRVHRLARG